MIIVDPMPCFREERAERTLLVRDAPPVLEYVRRGRREEDDRPVMLHVDRIKVTWINGALSYVRCEGRRLKADGKPGTRDGSVGYTSRSFQPDRLDATPEGSPYRPPNWLVELVREAVEPSMLEYQTQEDQRARRRA
jgi:hypothetical protein